MRLNESDSGSKARSPADRDAVNIVPERVSAIAWIEPSIWSSLAREKRENVIERGSPVSRPPVSRPAHISPLRSLAKARTSAPSTKDASPSTARFNERDLDHYSKLSLDEFIATASNKEGAKARFENFDGNKDGFISREEFSRQAK